MSDTEFLDQVQAIYRAAVTLRRNSDPLLAGQVEGVIGRLSALLAALGAAVPDDALPDTRDKP